MSDTPHLTARTLLVLGRVSNLPTVWTNVLCGWFLAGGGTLPTLLLLLACSSALYVGGMYLNDAFDAEFDRQHRRERPIPSEAISEKLVWQIGSALLAVGSLPLLSLGIDTALFTLLLVGCILLYDAVHKAVAFSPVIMAGCRFFLLLTAASAAADGVTGLVLWTAIALAGWIVGLSYVARRESFPGALAAWPLVVMAFPVVLALLVNNGPWRFRGIWLSLLVLAWAALCLRHTFTSVQRNLGRTVSGLLAGICLVDLLAAPPNTFVNLGFLACFGAALLFQRFIPAT